MINNEYDLELCDNLILYLVTKGTTYGAKIIAYMEGGVIDWSTDAQTAEAALKQLLQKGLIVGQSHNARIELSDNKYLITPQGENNLNYWLKQPAATDVMLLKFVIAEYRFTLDEKLEWLTSFEERLKLTNEFLLRQMRGFGRTPSLAYEAVRYHAIYLENLAIHDWIECTRIYLCSGRSRPLFAL